MKPSSKSVVLLAHLFLFVAITTSCAMSEHSSPDEVASKFIISLNANDMKTLTSLSAVPLWVRQQEWVSAKDGTGFVLGSTNDIHLTDHEKIKKYFSDPTKKISVERDIAEEATPTLLQLELKGSEQVWKGLSIQLFRRGMGDVEHIFVVGVDEKGMIAAVYMN